MPTVTANWDGTTAPTLPSDWNFTSGIITTTTVPSLVPTSSPNALECPGPVGTPAAYASYQNQDGNSGLVILQADFDCSIGFSSCGLFCRANSTPPPTTYYLANLSSTSVQLQKVISGTPTVIASVSTSSLGVNAWFTLFLTADVGGVFKIQVQRFFDGQWMNSSGTFQTGPAVNCISITGENSIGGQGYFGIYFQIAVFSRNVYVDGFALNPITLPIGTLAWKYPFLGVRRDRTGPQLDYTHG